ncbi:protein takeout-like isoform X2 [Cimex lectularius]|nr:protein takeout-like isoform X2 [Cimex lectularius]
MGEKDTEKCLSGAIEEAIKSLKHGNQMLGVMPLDPFVFKMINIEQGKGPVMINLKFKNFELHGFGDPNVDKVRFDPEKGLLQFRMNTTKDLVAKGEYSANGKILILPVVGEGNCSLTFENLSTMNMLKTRKVKNDDDEDKHLVVDDYTINFTTSKLKMNFGGMFHGDKRMGKHMNEFLNENWEVILSELKPAISKAFGMNFKEVANRIFSKIEVDGMTN